MNEISTLTHYEATRAKVDAIRQRERIDNMDINSKTGQCAAREKKVTLIESELYVEDEKIAETYKNAARREKMRDRATAAMKQIDERIAYGTELLNVANTVLESEPNAIGKDINAEDYGFQLRKMEGMTRAELERHIVIDAKDNPVVHEIVRKHDGKDGFDLSPATIAAVRAKSFSKSQNETRSQAEVDGHAAIHLRNTGNEAKERIRKRFLVPIQEN